MFNCLIVVRSPRWDPGCATGHVTNSSTATVDNRKPATAEQRSTFNLTYKRTVWTVIGLRSVNNAQLCTLQNATGCIYFAH